MARRSLQAIVAAGMAHIAAMPVAAQLEAWRTAPGVEIELFATIPDSIPVTLAWAPDGSDRLFIVDLRGQVVIIRGGALLAEPFVVLPAMQPPAANGAIGIAFDTNFVANGYVYFTTNYRPQPGEGGVGRIVRYTAVGDVATDEFVLLDNIPIGSAHQLEQILIGADGKLYASTGDGSFSIGPALAQDINDFRGKVLRLNLDGTAPSDNPFYVDGTQPRDYVWSLGHRNGFGITLRPSTGDIFLSENGIQLFDELNVITRAQNYGWRIATQNLYTGFQNTAPFIDPILTWYPTTAPTGLASTDGTNFDAGRFADGLFVTMIGDNDLPGPDPAGGDRIHWVRLTGSGPDTRVDNTGEIVQYTGELGDTVLDIAPGPDGNMYFTSPRSVTGGEPGFIYKLSPTPRPRFTPPPAGGDGLRMQMFDLGSSIANEDPRIANAFLGRNTEPFVLRTSADPGGTLLSETLIPTIDFWDLNDVEDPGLYYVGLNQHPDLVLGTLPFTTPAEDDWSFRPPGQTGGDPLTDGTGFGARFTGFIWLGSSNSDYEFGLDGVDDEAALWVGPRPMGPGTDPLSIINPADPPDNRIVYESQLRFPPRDHLGPFTSAGCGFYPVVISFGEAIRNSHLRLQASGPEFEVLLTLAPQTALFSPTNPSVVLPGDLDGSGQVNLVDLGMLLSSFGLNAGGDADCDGDTDLADLGIVLSNFGR